MTGFFFLSRKLEPIQILLIFRSHSSCWERISEIGFRPGHVACYVRGLIENSKRIYKCSHVSKLRSKLCHTRCHGLFWKFLKFKWSFFIENLYIGAEQYSGHKSRGFPQMNNLQIATVSSENSRICYSEPFLPNFSLCKVPWSTSSTLLCYSDSKNVIYPTEKFI